MPEELRVDAMELCVTACEKFSSNNEVYCDYSGKIINAVGKHYTFGSPAKHIINTNGNVLLGKS